MIQSVGRGCALFWALLFGVDVVGRLLAPGFDSALWWVDLRTWPAGVAYALLGLLALGLGRFAVRGRGGRALIGLTAGVVALMVADGLRFLALVRSGAVRSEFPVPMSFVSAASLLAALAAIRRGSPAGPLARDWRALGSAALLAIGFPVAQMFCFGLTDYTRPADVAVVFGARAYASGALSNALEHRVHTACDLYRRGLVRKLLMSGGKGDGAIHETVAMQREAIRLGVPAADILLDPAGVNTRETVRHTIPMLRAMGATRVLAVSHFYHLPRVKMTYQAAGFDVATVPAEQTRLLRQMPWLVLREVGGLWLYYLRASILLT